MEVIYIVDMLMWSTDNQHIINLVNQLNQVDVELEEENDVTGFLGVKLTKTQGKYIVMMQEGLADRLIDAMGLDKDNSTPKSTPCLKAHLQRTLMVINVLILFAYSSIVGMLLYLSGCSRPDIAYSVSQAAIFIFFPKRLHKAGIEMIGRYLLRTRNKGLLINPTGYLKIDTYHDADFAGLYNH